jgi:hypothetical protein
VLRVSTAAVSLEIAMVTSFRLRSRLGAVLAAVVLLPTFPVALAGGEIYGTIQTTDGEKLRGPIRWDRNEVFWDDLLNATRREPIKKEEGKREFNMSLFGLRLGGASEFTHHLMAIPFGHLRALEPISGREARLFLKNGEDLVVHSRSTDIGAGMRELVIEDEEKGAVNVRWESLQRVEFSQGAGPGRDAERLYGKVVTGDGTVEGFIVFDLNSTLAGDTLKASTDDGERELRLGDLSRVEPTGDDAARVTLGAEQPPIQMHDLNRGRGYRRLYVSPVGVGTVEIDWDDVERIDFAKPKASPRYDAFDGGRRLSGTLHGRDGKTWQGEIVWDRDESYTYDVLDGEIGDLEYEVPFANIRTIKRKSSLSSEIILRGGLSLELSGTNDVNDDNRGIIVLLADGTRKELDWEDLDRVDF